MKTVVLVEDRKRVTKKHNCAEAARQYVYCATRKRNFAGARYSGLYCELKASCASAVAFCNHYRNRQDRFQSSLLRACGYTGILFVVQVGRVPKAVVSNTCFTFYLHANCLTVLAFSSACASEARGRHVGHQSSGTVFAGSLCEFRVVSLRGFRPENLPKYTKQKRTMKVFVEGVKALTKVLLHRHPDASVKEVRQRVTDVEPSLGRNKSFKDLFPAIYTLCKIEQARSAQRKNKRV